MREFLIEFLNNQNYILNTEKGKISSLTRNLVDFSPKYDFAIYEPKALRIK